MTTTIPIIDLGPFLSGAPGALESTAAELRRACAEIGFFFIANHGVNQWLVDRVFEESERFHALPIEAKMSLKIDADNIGYMPMKGNLSAHSKVRRNKKPNLNESFILKRDRGADHPDVAARKRFRGLNRWPALPGFRETITAYMAVLELLGKRMLPLYAVALDMPSWFFLDHPAFRGEPQISLRIAHYPAQPAFDGEEFGSAPHTDGGFMTILAQAKVPGLEVMTRVGDWIKAPAIPGTFVVNTGDMLTRWSNDRFIATPHRVINASGRDRYSVPFFFDPNTEAVIECLASCQSIDNPAKYPPITYEQYYGAFTAANYLHLAQEQGAAE